MHTDSIKGSLPNSVSAVPNYRSYYDQRLREYRKSHPKEEAYKVNKGLRIETECQRDYISKKFNEVKQFI